MIYSPSLTLDFESMPISPEDLLAEITKVLFKMYAPAFKALNSNDGYIDDSMKIDIEQFIDMVFIKDGENISVNKEYINKLLTFIMQNIHVVLGEEYDRIVDRYVADNPDNSRIWMNLDKLEYADLGSGSSQSSDEYLLKLAATKVPEGKNIQVATEDISGKINIIDDVCYSGHQLERSIKRMLALRQSNAPLKITIYLCGITQYAYDSIMQLQQRHPGLIIEIKHNQIIKSIEDILADYPQYAYFFRAEYYIRIYNTQGSPYRRELNENALKYIKQQTLTRTAYRMPDGLSFYELIIPLFKGTTKKYPDIANFDPQKILYVENQDIFD